MSRPKISKPVKTGERTVIVHHDAVVDENEQTVTEAWDEEIVKPVYEQKTVEMTEEEYADFLASLQNDDQDEPTAEERLAAMEDALAEMMGVMFS